MNNNDYVDGTEFFGHKPKVKQTVGDVIYAMLIVVAITLTVLHGVCAIINWAG